MNIYEKLLAIQCELKAPKSQYNSFAKYNYRNCEDILEAVKPICKKYNAALRLTDEIICVGGRNYVCATAILVDCENPMEFVTANANAREDDEKKGMDGSQITGSSSSYARKYALNGLFDIDDTKDSDSSNNGDKIEEKKQNDHKKPEVPQSLKNSMNLQEAMNYTINFGVHKGKPFSQIPQDYLKWLRDNARDEKTRNYAEMVIESIDSDSQQLGVFDYDEDDPSIPF